MCAGYLLTRSRSAGKRPNRNYEPVTAPSFSTASPRSLSLSYRLRSNKPRGPFHARASLLLAQLSKVRVNQVRQPRPGERDLRLGDGQGVRPVFGLTGVP